MAGYRFSNFKTDKKKETDGVDVEFGAGLTLRVARIGNPRYEAKIAELRRPHLQILRRQQDSAEKDALIQEILQKVAAETVLLGWSGLTDDKDQPIPYSKEKALELFKDAPDFFEAVMDIARDVRHFRTDSLEASKGN